MLLHFLGVNLIFWIKVEIYSIFTKITCDYGNEKFIAHGSGFRILMGTWVL